MNETELINKIENLVAKQNLIEFPYSFINKIKDIKDINPITLTDCILIIINHNKKILEELKNNNKELENLLNVDQVEEEPKKEEPIIEEKVVEEKTPKKDLTDQLEVLYYTPLEELDNIIAFFDSNDISRLKLLLIKKIKELEKTIRLTLINNPLSNITSIQSDIKIYQDILNYLNTKKENIEEVKELNKIIFVPDQRNSTYLLNDISKYLDSSKEIKLILDKIISSYIFNSKDIKSIVSKGEKLYEYKHPNHIRVLFIKMPDNYIAITSLFFKDKQKSIKIDSYYDEAVKRYNNKKEYLLANLNDPDFIIEQEQLIGQIYDLLESNKSLKLKKAGV